MNFLAVREAAAKEIKLPTVQTETNKKKRERVGDASLGALGRYTR
jgi:hypothetical protein